MKKAILSIAALILAVSTAAPSYAFDGQRKGFLLGAGIGTGLTSYTQTLSGGGHSVTSDRENKGALVTDFKIGFGASEQSEIYYTSKVSWFGFTNALGNDVTVANGSSALGFSYSLRPTEPTYFITGGIALASWALPFESDVDTWYGFAIYGGAGYEFTKHYAVEFDLIYGNPNRTESGIKASTNALTLKLTINALAY